MRLEIIKYGLSVYGMSTQQRLQLQLQLSVSVCLPLCGSYLDWSGSVLLPGVADIGHSAHWL